MTANSKLLETAKTFNEETRKMFKSCKFAALNVHGPRSDWEVWGDFSRRADAVDAMTMWAVAFKGKVDVEMKGKLYRVTVTIP